MQIPFAIEKNSKEYVGIDQVQSGLACNCVCPSCNMDLVARKGNIKEHHFAHHKEAESSCDYSFWVAVRAMAEQLIMKGKIAIPSDAFGRISIRKTILDSYNRIHSPEDNVLVLSDGEKASFTGEYFKKNSGSIFNFSPDNNFSIRSIKKIPFDGNDFVLDTSIGKIFITLLTNESGREEPTYPSSIFVENIQVAIDLKPLSKIKNEEVPLSLRNFLLSSNKNKRVCSPSIDVMDNLLEIEERVDRANRKPSARIIENTGIDWGKIAAEKKKNWKEERERRNKAVQERREVIRSGPNEKIMKGFAERVFDSYAYDDKRTEDFSIIYKGKNLWFVSFNMKFSCIAFSGIYIAYILNDQGEIDFIGESQSLEDIKNEVVDKSKMK